MWSTVTVKRTNKNNENIQFGRIVFGNYFESYAHHLMHDSECIVYMEHLNVSHSIVFTL